MNAAIEMSRMLRAVAEPAVPGERVGHAIARAARRLGWSKGRTKRLWYGEARRIEAHEMDAIRRTVEARSQRDIQHEIADLRARLARLEATLAERRAGVDRRSAGEDGALLR